jgi:hypothetical protein
LMAVLAKQASHVLLSHLQRGLISVMRCGCGVNPSGQDHISLHASKVASHCPKLSRKLSERPTVKGS